MFVTLIWKAVKGWFGGSIGSTIRDYLPYILIGLVAIGIWWKVSSVISGYKEEIANLNTTIELKDKKITQLEKDLLVAELDAEVQKNNVLKLQTSIDTQNASIDKMKVNETALKMELEQWKHRPPETVVKYIEKKLKVKDLKVITDDNCRQVNEAIGNMKYDELRQRM